jgi:membrane-bound ClpP family serine protease
MWKNVIITIVITIVVVEALEHVIVPLIWVAFRRRKASVTGSEALVGQMVEVKQWQGAKGQVSLRGELWEAVCKTPLSPGDKAIVEEIDGMTLRVKPFRDGSQPPAGRG